MAQRASKGVKVDIFSEDACLMATTEVAEVAKKMGAKFVDWL